LKAVLTGHAVITTQSHIQIIQSHFCGWSLDFGRRWEAAQPSRMRFLSSRESLSCRAATLSRSGPRNWRSISPRISRMPNGLLTRPVALSLPWLAPPVSVRSRSTSTKRTTGTMIIMHDHVPLKLRWRRYYSPPQFYQNGFKMGMSVIKHTDFACPNARYHTCIRITIFMVGRQNVPYVDRHPCFDTRHTHDVDSTTSTQLHNRPRPRAARTHPAHPYPAAGRTFESDWVRLDQYSPSTALLHRGLRAMA
jgi:hypothetical protein